MLLNHGTCLRRLLNCGFCRSFSRPPVPYYV